MVHNSKNARSSTVPFCIDHYILCLRSEDIQWNFSNTQHQGVHRSTVFHPSIRLFGVNFLSLNVILSKTVWDYFSIFAHEFYDMPWISFASLEK